MNSDLNIPKPIQDIIDDIQNVDLCLVELLIDEHPKLPQFKRFIKIYDIDAKSRTEFVIFNYSQILKDKETGEEINIILPTPEWCILKDTWSYLRGTDNSVIKVPKKDNSEILEPIKVPSYRYMIWLLKNNKAIFIELIQNYLKSFVEAKIEELNK